MSPVALGVLGGSFNPVHTAHLIVAERAREALGLERVLFVPALRQPLKPDEELAPAADRLAMLRLATADHSAFEPCALELEREPPSYTVDTLEELLRREPGARLFLLLGSDTWRQFFRWRRAHDVLRLARVVVVPRPGEGLGPDAPPARGDVQDGVLALAVPALEISASDVRARVARGASVRYLVPEPVRRHILERGLYGAGTPPAAGF